MSQYDISGLKLLTEMASLYPNFKIERHGESVMITCGEYRYNLGTIAYADVFNFQYILNAKIFFEANKMKKLL